MKKTTRQAKWSESNPKAVWAHRALKSALAIGLLTRGPCENCGAKHEEGGAVVHGHHDDYDKPMAVRWLCAAHHRQHHVSVSRGRKNG